MQTVSAIAHLGYPTSRVKNALLIFGEFDYRLVLGTGRGYMAKCVSNSLAFCAPPCSTASKIGSGAPKTSHIKNSTRPTGSPIHLTSKRWNLTSLL